MTDSTMKSLLYITPVMPADGGNGLAMRAANVLRQLCRTYAVSLLIIPLFAPGTESELPTWIWEACADVQSVPPPARTGLAANVRSELLIAAWHAAAGRAYPQTHFDVIHLFRQSVYPFAEPFLQRFDPPEAEKWIDLDDVESRSYARLAELYQRRAMFVQRDQALRQAQAAAALEREYVRSWDRVFVCSANDREHLTSRTPDGRAEVVVLPNLVSLPGHPSPIPRQAPFAIIFVGNFDHFPNTDAAIWFCREVLPIIRERSEAPYRVLLIGTGAREDVISLGDIPEVEVVGPVEDLTPWYSRASLVVVPLRAGGGTRIKLLEALAYGRPVVSTSIGAEGIDVIDGKHLLIADRAHHFAQQCLSLLAKPELAARLATQGRQLIEERYTIERLLMS